MSAGSARVGIGHVPRRGATYSLLIGSVVAILAAGLAIPEAFGHAAGSATPTGGLTLPSGPARDYDPRLAPEYSDLSIVTSPPPPAGTALLASDDGITPTTVTLGVILPGLGALASFGVDVSELDPSIQRTYWASAVARINAAGGIDGRRLAVVYATASILSPDSMRSACASLTEDHHVFAVANVLGITGDPVLCVTRDHDTPYIGIDGEDPSYYQISQGRLVTLEPSTARTLSILVDRTATLGAIRGRTVGVLHDTGPGGIDGAALRAMLLARGARGVVDAPLSDDDPLIVTGEVAQAEQRMQRQRVSTVLLLTNAVYGTVFATQADQSHYSPTYFMGDLGFATAGDSFVSNMPPSFFRQAYAVTTTEVGRGRGGLPESPLDLGCRLDYQRFVGTAVPRDSADDVAALASCAVAQILTMGLTADGPNPTRAGFSADLAQAGSFALPGFGRGLLAPGHLDAADDVSLVAARADCQCYQAVDGFAPAS